MHCKSKHILARLTAINWIKEFVLLGKEQLIPHYGELLEAILSGTGHQEEEIRTTTGKFQKIEKNEKCSCNCVCALLLELLIIRIL